MEQAIAALIALIKNLLPTLGINSPVVDYVLNALAAVVPVIAAEAPRFKDEVIYIIGVLRSEGDMTDEQVAAAKNITSAVDADWDDALEAYRAAHPS